MQFVSRLRGLALALVATAVACSAVKAPFEGGQKIALEPTSQVQAAEGTVQAKSTDQGNVELEVEVEHMAPPEHVAPGTRFYVVWAKETGKLETEPAQNIGSLTIDKNAKGKLKTLTPLEKFELFVTPEAQPNAKEPTHPAVMKADIASP